MVSMYSIDPNDLINKIAKELKKTDLVQPPEWAQFVKTGVSKQRPPVDSDWWYIRAASVLRTVFKLGPVGVSKMRTKYGGKQNRGVRPEKFRLASGKILRIILQQLEKEGLVSQNKDDKKKGRIITSKGQSLFDKAAASLTEKKDSAKTKKEVSKTKKTQEKPSKNEVEKEAKEKKESKSQPKEESKKESGEE